MRAPLELLDINSLPASKGYYLILTHNSNLKRI